MLEKVLSADVTTRLEKNKMIINRGIILYVEKEFGGLAMQRFMVRPGVVQDALCGGTRQRRAVQLKSQPGFCHGSTGVVAGRQCQFEGHCGGGTEQRACLHSLTASIEGC